MPSLAIGNTNYTTDCESELEYQGLCFVGSHATINVSLKSIDRFKHRIRETIGRSPGISMEQRLVELARYVQGSMGYFKIASQLRLFASFVECLRRRIRCWY